MRNMLVTLTESFFNFKEGGVFFQVYARYERYDTNHTFTLFLFVLLHTFPVDI